ncbi:aminocarboxymuconate-semialdehyde decarboxylase [Actinomadura madurae]|uniref:Aminocarboxymuconate-semialdehyde decarboxylase n=1 Tax=Actinomadura madurae TaxID=1993 RepID=A0A1I5GNL0_9ACTN|nr:amidohydrolase family protein [Actinomadura madurae]SFO37509.1 aminocarboxymuconate-semialdehyde decarboxylase [Actinomadura madurae]
MRSTSEPASPGPAPAPDGPAAVDVHAHALPMPLLRHLADRGLADLSQVDSGTLLLDPGLSGVAQGARIPLPADQYDAGQRLASLEAAGIDVQLVAAPPFVFGSTSPDDTLVMEVTRRSNDALAAYTAEGDGRLAALGTVPVGLPGAAREAARCLDELGMAGLTVGTFGGGRELDDPVNEDLWALLTERRAFCLVHPSRASSPARLRDFHLVQLLGYPAETALAAARLIFGGVLDRHDPVLCLVHGGGCLPGLVPRLDLGWRRKREAGTIPASPRAHLRRLYFDTAVFDDAALRRLIEDVGHERVLLGTDLPFDLADVDAVATIRNQGLDPAVERALLAGNALRLIPSLTAQR